MTSVDDDPLFRLGAWLCDAGYRFVTVTPATHARVNARPDANEAKSLTDIFGWSRPFARALLPTAAFDLLAEGGALVRRGDMFASSIRFSTLGGEIYMHSPYPTRDADAVFFGPDTYRFAALIDRLLRPLCEARSSAQGSIIDIGCGAGAGGIVAARALQAAADRLVLADINPKALRYARINAALAGKRDARLHEGDLYAGMAGAIDVIVANPPYLADGQARLYRHGGGVLGTGLSERIVREGIPRLASNGIMILYTGSPIVDGIDTFRHAIEPVLHAARVAWDYAELDPDVFGEELDAPAYGAVDRIAVVALVIRAP